MGRGSWSNWLPVAERGGMGICMSGRKRDRLEYWERRVAAGVVLSEAIIASITMRQEASERLGYA